MAVSSRDAEVTRRPERVRLIALGLLLVVLVIVSFGVGTVLVPPWTAARILLTPLLGAPAGVDPTDVTVVLQVRLPRVLAGVLVGAALAASGAAYQSMFRNPLVSPEILGVAAAAGFGASLALLFGWDPLVLQVLAFGAGVLAAVLSLAIGRVLGGGSSIVLVLGGIVVGAMFQALISLTHLYINLAPWVSPRVIGLDDRDSAALVETIRGVYLDPDRQLRFHWTPGALAMWDNRVVQHTGTHDYGDRPRRMTRTCIARFA